MVIIGNIDFLRTRPMQLASNGHFGLVSSVNFLQGHASKLKSLKSKLHHKPFFSTKLICLMVLMIGLSIFVF